MTLGDIINFANDYHLRLSISIDSNHPFFIIQAEKGSKRIFRGMTLDVLQEPLDTYIRYELANMLSELEGEQCHIF